MKWQTFASAATAVAIGTALWTWGTPSAAFDARDGAETTADPKIDIVDVYAFPRPEKASASGPYTKTNHLVMVMTTHPGAAADARFDSSARYVFHVNKIFDGASLTPFGFYGADVSCTFDDAATQHATCAGNGVFATVTVGDTSSDDAGPEAPMRVFAGRRSNPSFADVAAYSESVTKNQLAFKTPGTNTFQNDNVLALVVEIDTTKVVAANGSLAPAETPTFALAVSGEVGRN